MPRVQRRYVPLSLDKVEDVEKYRPGGLHPISIGDLLAKGRYKVLHKLGFGGSSTVWLARDQRPHLPPVTPTNTSTALGPLVALKVLSARLSAERQRTEIAELAIPIKLAAFFRTSDSTLVHDHVQVVADHFMEEGPNGVHLCLVYPLAGPSVLSMSESPGRVSGSKRLRGDLARKVAKQTATALDLFHSAGLVHGDLTTSNILFMTSKQLHELDDNTLYWTLGGETLTEEVRTINDTLGECHSAPRELVEPVDMTRLSTTSHLQENIIVTDFGQSFAVDHLPKDYQPATAINYESPEARFGSVVSPASDIWALGCAIFEIRAGSPLFEPFFGSNLDILKQTVETLGKLPEPWWKSFENREAWLEENGEPKPKEVQERARLMISRGSSIRQKLREIGVRDVAPHEYEAPMTEITGTQLEEEEVELLGDLLEKVLKYRPDERITIREVLQHPWFNYVEGNKFGSP